MRHTISKPKEPPLSGPEARTNEVAVFIPTTGSEEELARAAALSLLADLTPRGKFLAKITRLKAKAVSFPKGAELIYAEKNKDLCGIDLRVHKLRIGPLGLVEEWVRSIGGYFHNQVQSIVNQIHRQGGIALVIADEKRDLGVIYLKR